MNVSLPDLLLRLLVAVLVLFVGDRILSLVNRPEVKQIGEVILIVAVVLYIVAGLALPLFK